LIIAHICVLFKVLSPQTGYSQSAERKGKGLKYKYLQIESAKKIIHATSSTSLTPVILGVRVRRKHT
jgi:hypothetical protein